MYVYAAANKFSSHWMAQALGHVFVVNLTSHSIQTQYNTNGRIHISIECREYASLLYYVAVST